MNRILEQVQSGDFDPLKMFTGNRDRFLEVKTAIENISNNLTKEACLEFLLSKIIPTAFDKGVSDATRDEAIEIGFHVLKFVNVSILDTKDQEKIFSSIEERYAKTVGELRDSNYANWDKLWIFLIRLCHDKIHAKMSLANKLLRVVEVAFRNSTSVDQRLKAYDCWKELIDNSSLNVDHMCSAKQIKLLVTPLKAKFSRTPVVINKRCDIFVYLLEKLQGKATLCLREFLEFCFGPFEFCAEDRNDVERMRQGRSVPDVCIKSTKVLMELLGHSHNEAEICVASGDIYLHKSVINESNFSNFADILLNSVVECCVLLNEWNTDPVKSNTIIKCLWRSLLVLIHKSSDDTRRRCCTQLNNSLRKLLERSEYNKHLDVLLGNVFVLLLKDDMIEYLREVLFDVAMNLLHRVKIDYCYFNEDEVLVFINSCFESGNGSKFSKIASNYFKNDSKCSNARILSEVWIRCDLSASSVPSLIWPVRYLQHFKDDTALNDKWTALYNDECKSEPTKVAILQETEKIFTENPLLASNIVKFLQIIANVETSPSKDFVARFMRLIELVLTLPNISDTDLRKLSTVVISYCDQKLYFYKLDGIEEALDKLCGCIEHIIAIHKDYNILKSLHDHLKKASPKLLAKFSKRLMSLLESLMLNEDNATANSSRKLIELLETRESEPESISLGSTRSLRIINMANGPPKPKRNSLKLFGRNNSDLSSALKANRLSTPKKVENKKKEIVFDEDRSSDYVKIDTEVKLDVSKLSEHQKEVLKKRREDIPALYQDLTQSQSRDLFTESNEASNENVIANERRLPSPMALGEETKMIEDIKTTEDTKTIEDTKIIEDTKTSEEVDTIEETKTSEESKTSEEIKIAEETKTSTETGTSEEMKIEESQTSEEIGEDIATARVKKRPLEDEDGSEQPDYKKPKLDDEKPAETKTPEEDVSKIMEDSVRIEEDSSFSRKSVKMSKKQPSKKLKQSIGETKSEEKEESQIGATNADEPDTKEEASNQSDESVTKSEKVKKAKNEEKVVRKSSRQVKRPDSFNHIVRRSRSKSKKRAETEPVAEISASEETLKKDEEAMEETSLRKSKRQQDKRQQREESFTKSPVEKKGKKHKDASEKRMQTKADRQENRKIEDKSKKDGRRSSSKSREESWSETLSDGNQNKILVSDEDNIAKQETIRQIVSKVKKQVMRTVSNEMETTSSSEKSSRGDVYEFTGDDELVVEGIKKATKKWKKPRISLGRDDYVVKRRKKAKSKTNNEEQTFHVTADCSTPIPLSKSQSLRAVPSPQESETITIVITRSPPEEADAKDEAEAKPSPSKKKPKRKLPDSEDVIESSQPPITESGGRSSMNKSRSRKDEDEETEEEKRKTRSSTVEFPAKATGRRHSLTEASTDEEVDQAKRRNRSKSLDKLDPDSEVTFLTTTSTQLPDTLTAPTPGAESNDLPGSPITCDTPDRTVELLNNTLDISPITSAEEEEVKKPTPVLTTKEMSNMRVARLLQMVNPDVPVSNESPRWFGKRTTSSPSTSRVRKMRMRKEENLDILTFSREVPSPLTVPASGILKRKFSNLDETATPSPKRKRVNFSDPAITEKKLFIKESEEYEQVEESTKESFNSLEDRDVGNRQDMILGIKEFCDSKLRDSSSTDCSELKSALRRLIQNLNVPEIVEVVAEYLTDLDRGRMSEVSKALVDGELVDGTVDRCVMPLLENQQVFEVFLPRLVDVLEKLPEVKIERFLKELARVFGDNRIDGVFKKYSNDKEAEEHVVNNFDCDRMKEMIKKYFVTLEEGGRKEQFLVDLIGLASGELPHTKEFLQVHVDVLKNFVNRMMDDC